MIGAPPPFGNRNAAALQMKRSGAVHKIYRQRLEMLLPPSNPHECSRIASKLTVRPEFEVTVWRR